MVSSGTHMSTTWSGMVEIPCNVGHIPPLPRSADLDALALVARVQVLEEEIRARFGL